MQTYTSVLSAIDQQIDKLAGRKGVTALREKRERVVKFHHRIAAQLDCTPFQQRDDWNKRITRQRIESLAATNVTRGYYQELELPSLDGLETHPKLSHLRAANRARKMMRKAIDELPELNAASASFDRKGRGNSINHSLYAYSSDAAIVIVQERHFTASKYGGSVKFFYYVTDGETVVEITGGHKSLVKRAAAQDPAPDSPLRALAHLLPDDFRQHVQGDFKFVAPARPEMQTQTAYKILARSTSGQYESIYNPKYQYAAGKWYAEAAREQHGGGFYVSTTIEAARGRQFREEWVNGRDLVLCEVSVRGRGIEYSNGKMSFSFMRIERELEAA